MFGFLPAWASDVMVLLAFFAGPTGLIWGILQRKGANRALVVTEDAQDLSEFDKLTAKYGDYADRAEKAAERAEGQVSELRTQVEELKSDQRELKSLFREVIADHKIKLTADQKARFDALNKRPYRAPRSAN